MITDYTQLNTFNNSINQQYRVLKYIKDLINNWVADKDHIEDPRLFPLLYDKDGNLKPGCIRIDTVFDENHQYIGLTPAIIVSLGDIQYLCTAINYLLNPAFINNKNTAPTSRTMNKKYSLEVSVITEGYDATVLLALLLLLFLQCNRDIIKSDCKLLDFFTVVGVSKPAQIKPGLQTNAKQLYMSTIMLLVSGHVSWLNDTQGPVYNGILLNLTKE